MEKCRFIRVKKANFAVCGKRAKSSIGSEKSGQNRQIAQ